MATVGVKGLMELVLTLSDSSSSCSQVMTNMEADQLLTATCPQDNLRSLWHFLCTSSLQLIHLNPCRPRPQIRSEQYAQNAFYSITQHTNQPIHCQMICMIH